MKKGGGRLKACDSKGEWHKGNLIQTSGAYRVAIPRLRAAMSASSVPTSPPVSKPPKLSARYPKTPAQLHPP
ncbi:hypothetical protein NG798_10845 [Ancylothrix sp. C2]|nr:hypothetical protein [Ancylothrix sp. D3o]